MIVIGPSSATFYLVVYEKFIFDIFMLFIV